LLEILINDQSRRKSNSGSGC